MGDEDQSLGILSKVSFVNKISKIVKATSDDDKPIPGYLYAEISNITLESDGFCESTLEFLVDRLNKKSCHVKIKVLKLMKYVIENGHPHFKLGLQKKSKGVQEATNLGGPPDPLHGNVPYLMVRKAAKDLNEVLFAITSDASGLPDKTRVGPRTVQAGMGPNTSQMAGSLQGFGNVTTNQTKSLSDSIVEGISRLADRISETPADQQRALLSVLERKDGAYKPPTFVTDGPTFEENSTDLPPTRKNVRKHIAGRAGGGWEDEDIPLETAAHKSSGTRSGNTSDLSDRLEGDMLEDCTNEDQLVSATLDGSHDRLLTRAEIVNFLKSCTSLNCDKVLEIVNHKLSSDEANILMACLLLVEGFLSSDLVSLDLLVRVCKDNLLHLYSSRQGPVKSKCRKIIRTVEALTNQQIILPYTDCGANTLFSDQSSAQSQAVT